LDTSPFAVVVHSVEKVARHDPSTANLIQTVRDHRRLQVAASMRHCVAQTQTPTERWLPYRRGGHARRPTADPLDSWATAPRQQGRHRRRPYGTIDARNLAGCDSRQQGRPARFGQHGDQHHRHTAMLTPESTRIDQGDKQSGHPDAAGQGDAIEDASAGWDAPGKPCEPSGE